MEESDTYLMTLDEGQAKHAKKAVLIVGEERFGPPDESVRTRLEGFTDLERLDRMILQAVTAASWQEILDTP
jgi:16S rRNA U1498 N3-methylase RsmE